MKSSLLYLKINGICEGVNIIHFTLINGATLPCEIETPKMHVNTSSLFNVAINKTPNYSCMQFRQKSASFLAVFALRFIDDRCMYRYEFHPPHLISVATLPCEIRNSDNVKLQEDLTKNGIKFILASSKCHVPDIYLFYN